MMHTQTKANERKPLIGWEEAASSQREKDCVFSGPSDSMASVGALRFLFCLALCLCNFLPSCQGSCLTTQLTFFSSIWFSFSLFWTSISRRNFPFFQCWKPGWTLSFLSVWISIFVSANGIWVSTNKFPQKGKFVAKIYAVWFWFLLLLFGVSFLDHTFC